MGQPSVKVSTKVLKIILWDCVKILIKDPKYQYFKFSVSFSFWKFSLNFGEEYGSFME